MKRITPGQAPWVFVLLATTLIITVTLAVDLLSWVAGIASAALLVWGIGHMNDFLIARTCSRLTSEVVDPEPPEEKKRGGWLRILEDDEEVD